MMGITGLNGLFWCAQIVIASVIEDRIQRRYYMVPFSAKVKRPTGRPRRRLVAG